MLEVTNLNAMEKENLSNYYKFNSKEFYDIFTAYLIIVFLMFGPGYMTMISKIKFMFNNFNPPTHIFWGFFDVVKLAIFKKRFPIGKATAWLLNLWYIL